MSTDEEELSTDEEEREKRKKAIDDQLAYEKAREAHFAFRAPLTIKRPKESSENE